LREKMAALLFLATVSLVDKSHDFCLCWIIETFQGFKQRRKLSSRYA
jgi:hypothetical protein